MDTAEPKKPAAAAGDGRILPAQPPLRPVTAAGACCASPRLFRPTNQLVLATDRHSSYHVHASSICVVPDCLRVTVHGAPGIRLTLHPAGAKSTLDLHQRVLNVKGLLNQELTKERSDGFPDPYDLYFLGRSPTVKGIELFNDFEEVHKKDGHPGLHEHVRRIFGLDPAGRVRFPSPIGDVVVTDTFVRHLPELRQNGNGVDADHMRYISLTPSTIVDPDEGLFGKIDGGRDFYTLLKTYIVDDNDQGTFMLFHRVLVFPDGHLRTSHRLNGEARAFHGKRKGTLKCAGYVHVV